MSTNLNQLSTILITKFHTAPQKIQPTSTFVELELDSLALIEFAEIIKEEFKIVISDEELSAATTLADIEALLTSKIPAP